MSRISIVSLGCPKNLVDSDNLLSDLEGEGILYTPETEDADLVLVNTCGFIEDAKRESIEEILKLKHIKKKGKQLLVFGCLAERYREELIREIPEIDGIWGVGEEDKIVEYCKKIGSRGMEQSLREVRNTECDTRGRADRPNGQRTGHKEYTPSPDIYPSYAYLKIAEGCDRGCTFCVIPSIRGAYKSIMPDKVLKKAEEHISAGIKELILVAQDIGGYGSEFGGYKLPSLLKDISSISGDFWIRLLYLYPAAIDDELLSVISAEHKVCKYIDMPLQHSEDKILRAMGRGGTKRLNTNLIEKIRKTIPDVTLRTTFIVGFPGETEEDFIGLRDFIEKMRFERLGVFGYSKEEGTPAYRMKNNVPKGVKEKRRDEIMRIQSYISLEKNISIVGRKFEAIVDDVDGSVAIARLYSQAPEIDGVVVIEERDAELKKSGIQNPKSKIPTNSNFVTLEIVGAYDYDLKGVLVDDCGLPNAGLKSEARNLKKI